MAYTVPKKLIGVIERLLITKYLPQKILRHKKGTAFNKRDLLFFARGAALLSNAFTRGRGRLPKNYLNLKEFRSGYILYFTVTNYLKTLFCLREAFCARIPEGPIEVLDIGTGPGTALIAAADFFKRGAVRLTGVDQNRDILKDARSIIDSYIGGGLDLKLFTGHVTDKNAGYVLRRKRFHVIFLSNIVGEIGDPSKRFRLIDALRRDHLEKGGLMIVIEPALQKTTRELMELRDSLLAHCRVGVSIVSPCLHNGPCPMLTANHRDWCHMYLEWERPQLIERVDRLIENRKDYLKFSYLIITQDAQRTAHDEYRVVSSPLVSKGKTELLICGNDILRRLVQQDRHRVRGHVNLIDLKRGNLIRYSGPDKVESKPDIELIKVP